MLQTVMEVFLCRKWNLHYKCMLCVTSYYNKTTWDIFSYSMEQNPSWDDSSFSPSREIPWVLWKPKFHYRYTQVSAICRYRELLCDRLESWNVYILRSCWHFAKPPSWRNTACLLSMKVYSLYLQPPFILEAVRSSTT